MKIPCAIILATLSCFFFLSSGAQSSFLRTGSFGSQMHFGSFLTMDPKAQYLRDSYTYFGEVYLQRINKEWSTINKPVEWGISLLFGNTGSQQYMGNFGGAFSFINTPVIQQKKFASKLRIGAGLGWVQKPYDKEVNHKNVLIGTSLNGLFNFMWQNEYSISKHFSVSAGLSFTHLSNGASTLPNLGINIPAVSLGVRYAAEKPVITREAFGNDFSKKRSFTFYTSAGIKQLPWIGSQRYLVNIVNAEITKQFAHNQQYGGGLILFYDRSMQVNPYTITSDKRKNKNVQAGIYASYEYFFGKISLPLQLNAYIYNKDIYSALFQQIGVRYKVSKQFSAHAMLKTHGGKADVIHAGIGYKLK